MEEIEIKKLENEEDWTNFLKFGESKLQHTLLFRNVIEKTYNNCKSVYYIAFSGSKILGIFPFFLVKSKIFRDRLISLPFIDACGFLFEEKNALKKIVEKIKEEYNANKIEIRLNTFIKNFEVTKGVLLKEGFAESNEKKQAIIELKSEDKMWNEFHKHTRNDIRKAEKSELTIKKINNEIELRNFYKLYLNEMGGFGTPQHAYKFFDNLLNILGNNFYGVNCYKNDILAGSLILLHYKNQGYIAFNVSNEKYRQYRPNDLLYWETIKWAIKHNIQYLDLGQIDVNSSEDSHAHGLYKFKNKWLCTLYERVYFNYPNTKELKGNKDEYKKFRSVWSKLPKFILKLIGPKICSELGI